MKKSKSYSPHNISAFVAKALAWAQQFDVIEYITGNGFENGFKHLLGIQIKAQQEEFPVLNDGKWKLGFITYDFKNQLESAYHSTQNTNRFEFPDYYFFEPDILFVFENESFILSSKLNNETEIIDQIESFEIKFETKNEVKFQLESDFDSYKKYFTKLQEHIIKGDIYITNYCISLLSQNADFNPLQIFLKLNTQTPTPFASFVKYNEQYLICASPERFIKKDKQIIISQPIKGTAPRGENAIEDQENIEKLKSSIKEQSENVMVVDLVRNDLSRICEKVKVAELFGIYSFETVHQMITTIEAQLNTDIDFETIINALFPMGSMTGAPKINAVNLCSEIENFNRELYSGSVGYINPDGDFDFNVVIRSILYNKNTQTSTIRVGSAVTYSAEAEQEWNECLLKAQSLTKVFEN